jgi:hypothetical protein
MRLVAKHQDTTDARERVKRVKGTIESAKGATNKIAKGKRSVALVISDSSRKP